MFGNLPSGFKAKLDNGRQRGVPPPATPVQLPLAPPREVLSLTEHTAEEVHELFLSIHKTGPTAEHAQALNVRSVTEVALEQLLPSDAVPPISWQQDPGTTGGSNTISSSSPPSVTLSNGSHKPAHNVYFSRVKELLFDNGDAYQAIGGDAGLPDRPLVRIAHFRKFWDALSQMADYWDTTQDQYNSSTIDGDRGAVDLDQADPETRLPTYTGHRISTGKDMPPKYRDDAVFAFVETIAFAFRCRVDRPRTEPKVKLHNLLIPLLQTGSVYRYPKDSKEARQGILEGPLLGIHCTNQMVFRRPEEAPGQGQGELANFLRELGLIFSIAEKRSREGQTEPAPGQSEWWLTKPRWGGARDAGEIGIAEEAPKEVELRLPFAQELGNDRDAKSEPPSGRTGTDRTLRRQDSGDDNEGSAKSRKRTKRSSAIDCWRNLQPSQSSWEKHVHYKQIGRHKQATHDDIYIVSALMHHISILHVRVHPRYTEYLKNPILTPDFIPSQQPWYALDVRRSSWFDLLDKHDREQAMRGVWGVMNYQMRNLGEYGA